MSEILTIIGLIILSIIIIAGVVCWVIYYQTREDVFLIIAGSCTFIFALVIIVAIAEFIFDISEGIQIWLNQTINR